MDNLRTRLHNLGFQDTPDAQELLKMSGDKGIIFEKQVCDNLEVMVLVDPECTVVASYCNYFHKRNDANLKNLAKKAFRDFQKELKDYCSDDFDLTNIE